MKKREEKCCMKRNYVDKIRKKDDVNVYECIRFGANFELKIFVVFLMFVCCVDKFL